MDNKKLFELTPEEVAQRSALTPEEKVAVDAFIAAAAALPDTICVDVESLLMMSAANMASANLIVSKRITSGFSVPVAKLRKISLSF